jgi:hypothetical protein
MQQRQKRHGLRIGNELKHLAERMRVLTGDHVFSGEFKVDLEEVKRVKRILIGSSRAKCELCCCFLPTLTIQVMARRQKSRPSKSLALQKCFPDRQTTRDFRYRVDEAQLQYLKSQLKLQRQQTRKSRRACRLQHQQRPHQRNHLRLLTRRILSLATCQSST